MIARLRGEVLEAAEGVLVVEAGGVGYEVSTVAGPAARRVSAGAAVELWIVESVALYGGGTTLYGFWSAEERRLFNALREHVPGTGAKKALEYLEKIATRPGEFERAVGARDARALVGFGFTAKTAEKLVAALQGKLEAAAPTVDVPAGGALEEAVAGLVALGYREPAARTAVQSVRSAAVGASAQDLIRESLRHLSGRS